jgi:hypothetical protein
MAETAMTSGEEKHPDKILTGLVIYQKLWSELNGITIIWFYNFPVKILESHFAIPDHWMKG